MKVNTIIKVVIILAIIYSVPIFLTYFYQEKLLFNPVSVYRMPPKSFDIEQKFIKKENGDSLYTWWQENNNTGETLVFFNGNAGNITGRTFFVDIAYKLGQNILLFDYTGFGASSGEILNKQNFYDDANYAIEYLINAKNIKQENITFWAVSLGGTIAMKLTEKFNIRAVILEGVMTSIEDVIYDMNLIRYDLIPINLILKYDFNTLESLKKLDKPMLVLHSIDDKVVPFNHAEVIYQNIKNKNKKVIELSGNHQDAHYISYDKYINNVEYFLNSL